MPRPRMACAVGIAVAALTGAALPGFCADPPVRRADAHKLVQIAETACAGASARLDPRDPRLEPLRACLSRMQSVLGEVQGRLEARDLGFFQALRSGTRTLAEMAVVLPRTGLQDPEAQREIQSLSAAYARLRNRYGTEWLRFRTGQPLNEEERQRFERLRADEALLADQLAVLIARAQAAGDARTAAELARVAAQATSVARAPDTLDEALNASVVADTIQGEYAAIREANPADAPEWNATDNAVEELSTDASVGFVFTTDLKTVQQWSYTREETDLPAEVADSDIPGSRAPARGALDEALAAARRSPAPPVVAEPVVGEPDADEASGEAMLAGDDPDAMEDAEAAEDEVPAPVEAPAAPVASASPQMTSLPDAQKPPLRGFLL